jgi:hypothetical protein
MKNKNPLYRIFTVIVDPKYFEVDKHKEGTFELLAEDIENESMEDLNKYFYDRVVEHYKPKSFAMLFWFETTEKELV